MREDQIATPEDAVRAYYRLIDSNSALEALEIFHEDAVYHRPGYEPISGMAALRQYYLAQRVIEHGEHTLACLVHAGSVVATRGRMVGWTTTQGAVDVGFADFFEFMGGKVRERHTYFDVAAV